MSHWEEMENTLRENEFIFLIQNSPCTVMGLWQCWTFEKVYTAFSSLFDLYTNGFLFPVTAFSELLQTLKWEIKMDFWEDRTCHNHSVTLQLAMQGKIQRRYWSISEVVTPVEFCKRQNPSKSRGQSCGIVCMSATSACRWAGGDKELTEVLLCRSALAEERCMEGWKPMSQFLLKTVAHNSSPQTLQAG